MNAVTRGVFRRRARVRKAASEPATQRPWLEKIFVETVGLLSRYVVCVRLSIWASFRSPYDVGASLRANKVAGSQYACLITCLFVLAALQLNIVLGDGSSPVVKNLDAFIESLSAIKTAKWWIHFGTTILAANLVLLASQKIATRATRMDATTIQTAAYSVATTFCAYWIAVYLVNITFIEWVIRFERWALFGRHNAPLWIFGVLCIAIAVFLTRTCYLAGLKRGAPRRRSLAAALALTWLPLVAIAVVIALPALILDLFKTLDDEEKRVRTRPWAIELERDHALVAANDCGLVDDTIDCVVVFQGATGRTVFVRFPAYPFVVLGPSFEKEQRVLELKADVPIANLPPARMVSLSSGSQAVAFRLPVALACDHLKRTGLGSRIELRYEVLPIRPDDTPSGNKFSVKREPILVSGLLQRCFVQPKSK